MASASVQPDLWGTHPQDWTYKAEPNGKPLWRALLKGAKIKEGTKMLDVGCGGGGLSVLAGVMGAEVHGIDASEGLLGVARKRGPAERFVHGDFEHLPWPDHTFDAVVACNSIQFANDPAAAVKEALRVKKLNGFFAMGMWAEPEKNEMTVVMKAVGEVMPAPATNHAPPSLAEKANLISMLESAGVKIAEVQDVPAVFEFDSVEEGWLGMRSAGMLVGAAAVIGEAKLKAAIVSALKQFAQSDGTVKLKNCFRCVIGT